jgi:hypothetical protein
MTEVKKLVKSQSGHAEKVTSDLQRVFPHDHSVIWQVFWFAKLFHEGCLTTIAMWECSFHTMTWRFLQEVLSFERRKKEMICILFPKLIRPTVTKIVLLIEKHFCFWDNLNNLFNQWNVGTIFEKECFLTCSWRFSDLIH